MNAIACAPLRDVQVEVVSNSIAGHDAFGVLSSGFTGKASFFFPSGLQYIILTTYLE